MTHSRPIPWALVAGLLCASAAAQTPRPKPSPASPAEKPVTQKEIDDLRRELVEETRSSLEIISELHRESGDANNELDFARFGARLNVKRGPATTFFLSGQRTPYRTRDRQFESSSTRITAGLRSRSPRNREGQAELSATRWSDGHWGVTGLAAATFWPTDALRASVTLQRTSVEESLLSVAGLHPVVGPFAGARVGSVYDNRLAASGAYRLPARLDVYAEAAIGSRSGSQVDGNSFRRAGGGIGYVAVARAEDRPLSLLRLSLSVDYFGFADDRLGYGGASFLDAAYRPVPAELLGSDGISPLPSASNPGVGGYFSPHHFVSRGVRLEVRGRPRSKVEYRASGFLGTQSFTGVSGRRAGGLFGGATFRLSDRLTLPVTVAWDDYGPFEQTSLAARLVVLF